MALSATTTWEVQTGGSDTANSGAFDPGQTAGMFTDGAATVANTSAPVFTSASYNFVAGDVGASVFIASGTNWTPGWYKIASVAANAATLTGTIGTAITLALAIPSTVIGCATTASPTGATWSIDYSQQAAVQFAYTDLASAGAGLTVSSAAKPFAKQQVGNSLIIASGTNFTAGRYVLASVAASVATVVGPGNITSGAGASGVGGQGGALASPGLVGAVAVASNTVWIKTGTYTVTSASTNIAAGCLSTSVAPLAVNGYASVRGDLWPLTAAGTRPTIVASGISTFTFFTLNGAGSALRGLILNGATLTSSRGANIASGSIAQVHGMNLTNSLIFGSQCNSYRCTATTCSTQSPFLNTGLKLVCLAYANTTYGFGAGNCVSCMSYANTGSGSDGFQANSTSGFFVNCVAYNNGASGFWASGTAVCFLNCISEGNVGSGFKTQNSLPTFVNCGTYNNTAGVFAVTFPNSFPIQVGMIAGSGSFFTNPGSGDFSLNNTAGALLQGAADPGVYPVGLTTGYLDIGAAQHAAVGGATAFVFG